jgi:hypothetical protein
MSERKQDLALSGGLSQDHIPITIRADRARSLHQPISVNHFFESTGK